MADVLKLSVIYGIVGLTGFMLTMDIAPYLLIIPTFSQYADILPTQQQTKDTMLISQLAIIRRGEWLRADTLTAQMFHMKHIERRIIMIDFKKLTKTQIIALEIMASFCCRDIVCDDCPLNTAHDCGSTMAQDIIDEYEKETLQ